MLRRKYELIPMKIGFFCEFLNLFKNWAKDPVLLPSGSAWYVGLSWTSAPQNGCHPRSIKAHINLQEFFIDFLTVQRSFIIL